MKAGRPEEEMEPEPESDPKLAEQLARWAERERDLVEEASRAVTEEDRRRAATAFGELAPKRTRSRFTSPGPLLVAAAFVIAVGVTAYLLGRGDAPDDGRTWLDRSVERELRPNGPVPEYDEFTWASAEAELARFDLRVFNGDEIDEALEVVGLTDASYRPSAEERARLGDEIRWEVVRTDANGEAIELWGSASASRSPR